MQGTAPNLPGTGNKVAIIEQACLLTIDKHLRECDLQRGARMHLQGQAVLSVRAQRQPVPLLCSRVARGWQQLHRAHQECPALGSNRWLKIVQ